MTFYLQCITRRSVGSFYTHLAMISESLEVVGWIERYGTCSHGSEDAKHTLAVHLRTVEAANQVWTQLNLDKNGSVHVYHTKDGTTLPLAAHPLLSSEVLHLSLVR